MKKRADVVLILAFCLFCIAMPVWGALTELGGKETASEENRVLEQLPQIQSVADLEAFPAAFADYFSDHLFFKENLVSLKSMAELTLFGELDSEKVIAGTKRPWLFNCSEDGQPLQTYKKTNRFDAEELAEITANLTALQMDLADAGIDFVLMISPDKEQIYGTDYMHGSVKREEGDSRTEQFVGYLETNAPDICVVYPKDALIEAKDRLEVPVYYESDTHWNLVGASIANEALLQAIAEMRCVDYQPQNIEITGTERKRGDLQKLVKLGSRYDSTEYLLSMQTNAVQQEAMTDQNGEIILERSCNDAERALPVKLYLTGDSFRWNLSPLLKEGVSAATISSRYYFDPEDLVQEEPDVFVYMIAERYLHELSVIPGYNTMALQMR